MTPAERERFERVLTREVVNRGGMTAGMAMLDNERAARWVYRVDWTCSLVQTVGGCQCCSQQAFLDTFRLDSTADVNGGPLVRIALMAAIEVRDNSLPPGSPERPPILAKLSASIGGLHGKSVRWNGFAGPNEIYVESFAVVAGELLLSVIGVDWRTAVLTGGEPSDPLADDEGDEPGGAA